LPIRLVSRPRHRRTRCSSISASSIPSSVSSPRSFSAPPGVHPGHP
jgi:hypothetical protein